VTGRGRGRLVVLSGPSGVGKSTVCQRLVASGRYVLSVSATTRPPRGHERDGVDYHFLDRAEFERRIEAGDFLEWAHVHQRDTLYGTLKGPVLAELEGGTNVLLDIDVQGAAQLRRDPDLPLVTIFIEPPGLDELERRLRGRGDTDEEAIARRLENARSELAQADRYDHRVVNRTIEQTVADVEGILGEG